MLMKYTGCKFRRCSIKWCTAQAVSKDGEYYYCAEHTAQFEGKKAEDE